MRWDVAEMVRRALPHVVGGRDTTRRSVSARGDTKTSSVLAGRDATGSLRASRASQRGKPPLGGSGLPSPQTCWDAR